MVDVFDEVEEQLRSERYKSLAFKVLPWIGGLLVIALVAALAVWGYQHFRAQAAAEASEKYAQAIEAFKDGVAPVFLISLKAGGFGLTLTEADYVFILDPWWNPAAELQAIDRTHRIGQTRPVMAYRLIARNSIEEKIRLLQKSKSSLASAVLGEEQFAKALTLDDLRFLLDPS